MLGSSQDREWLVGNGAKAISGENDTAGGYLAPSSIRNEIIVLQEQHGKFRAATQVWPLSSDFEVVPKQTGELTVYCPGAGTAPTESDPTFGQVGIQAHEWLTYTLVNRNISEDAVVAVGQIVGNSIARAFAKQEDNCGFNGDASATYFNITGLRAALRAVDATIANIAGLVVAAGNAYSEITLANFESVESVVGVLPEYADEGAAWYCSRTFYWTVMARVALAVGGANATEVQMFEGTSVLGIPRQVRASHADCRGQRPDLRFARGHCLGKQARRPADAGSGHVRTREVCRGANRDSRRPADRNQRSRRGQYERRRARGGSDYGGQLGVPCLAAFLGSAPAIRSASADRRAGPGDRWAGNKDRSETCIRFRQRKRHWSYPRN